MTGKDGEYINERQVHGFMLIAFDDYRIPAHIWKQLTVCTDTGCWEYRMDRPQNIRRVMVMRLLAVTREELFAVTPTCGNKFCARPSHTCVTLK